MDVPRQRQWDILKKPHCLSTLEQREELQQVHLIEQWQHEINRES